LLAGTAGGNVDVKPKEWTAKDYKEYVEKYGKAPE